MKIFKYILILAFALILMLPHLNYSKETKVEKPIFTYNYWKNGKYQKNIENHIGRHCANKTFLEQLTNQIDFTFFGRLNNPDYLLGLNKYVFKKSEVEEFKGKGYIGSNYIKQYLRRIEYVSNKLEEKGAKLILLINPSKVYCNAQNVIYDEDISLSSNYRVFQRELSNYDILSVDGNKFLQERSSKKSFFTNLDNRVSMLGTLGVLDTVVKIANLGLENPLNKIVIDGNEVSLEQSNDLKLLFNSNKMSVIPEFHYGDSNPVNNKILCVGDSSLFDLYNTEFATELFKESSFWLNFKYQINTDFTVISEDLNNLNIIKTAEENNVVLLAIHPSRIGDFSNGFIDYMYNFYSPTGGLPSAYSDYENGCKSIEENLISNQESKKLIYEQAQEKGVNYYDNIRGHVEAIISLQKKYLDKNGKRLSDYECQNIIVKNQFFKLPHKRKAIADTAKKYNWYFNFAMDYSVLEAIERTNAEGFGFTRDSVSPLQLEIYNVENRILADTAWSDKVDIQSKEREIPFVENLWLNAKYSTWVSYFEHYKTLDEAQRWVGGLYYTNEILKNKKWVDNIKLMSETFDYPYEELFEENVRYLIYVNKDKLKLEFTVDQAKLIENQVAIRKNEDWSNKVRKEAKEKGISYEACLRGHAAWTLYQSKQGNL